jgi:superfamily I DNA and/or RNA helicase
MQTRPSNLRENLTCRMEEVKPSPREVIKQIKEREEKKLEKEREGKWEERENALRGEGGGVAGEWGWQEEGEAQTAVLNDAQVICCQLISAGGDFLRRAGNFEAILIDEVAQSTEMSAIVPIAQRGCSRLVLAGDHCQLPPCVQSLECEARGGSLSLYSRLIASGVVPHFLDTQYRAHPSLMEFSSAAVYGGRLRNGIEPSQRPAIDGFPWPNQDVPVCFFEGGGAEEKDGESRCNRSEALQVMDVLDLVLSDAARGLTQSDVGVVTAYSAQVILWALKQGLRVGGWGLGVGGWWRW